MILNLIDLPEREVYLKFNEKFAKEFFETFEVSAK